MRNVREMQDKLSELYDQVKSGEVEIKKADTMTNICGKMIAGAKAQLSYYEMRKEKPKIAFLSTPGNSDEAV